jgi:uncharacterized protein GlcG (DUF336 family)
MRTTTVIGAQPLVLIVVSILLVSICLTIVSCGDGNGDSADPLPDEIAADPLQPDEVGAIMNAAARALDQEIAVAVTDRRGVVLGVGTNFGMDQDDYRQRCVDAVACPLFDAVDADCRVVELAVQLARTAALFSADQTPLTSRSIRALSGVHFPDGVKNTAAAALFGIENTNRGCSLDATEVPEPLADSLPRPKSLSALLRPAQLPCDSLDESPSRRCGCTAGIATLPGGVPIYKSGRMSGGIGVAARGVLPSPDPVAAFDDPGRILRKDDGDAAFELTEFAARAFAGDAVGIPTLRASGLVNVCAAGSAPACCGSDPPCFFSFLPALPPLPFDPVIFVDGVEIPEVELKPRVSDVGSGAPFTEPLLVAPAAVGVPVPSGWLLTPRDGTDAPPLSATEVEDIISAGVAEADRIRAAIRLPLKARSKMVLAVTDTNGTLLGVFRMNDATVFSIDVAIAKARNVSYFSSDQIDPTDTLDCPGTLTADCGDQFFSMGCVADANDCTAMTNRTIGFGSQPFFPSGIDGSRPGPFRRIFIDDSALPCTNARQPSNGRQNGVVFFPGSAPLYKNGALAGGLGVSGDGVEQDDLVTFAGTRAAPGFEPSARMRADQLRVRGVRLPYFKFNRRPEQ